MQNNLIGQRKSYTTGVTRMNYFNDIHLKDQNGDIHRFLIVEYYENSAYTKRWLHYISPKHPKQFPDNLVKIGEFEPQTSGHNLYFQKHPATKTWSWNHWRTYYGRRANHPNGWDKGPVPNIYDDLNEIFESLFRENFEKSVVSDKVDVPEKFLFKLLTIAKTENDPLSVHRYKEQNDKNQKEIKLLLV